MIPRGRKKYRGKILLTFDNQKLSMYLDFHYIENNKMYQFKIKKKCVIYWMPRKHNALWRLWRFLFHVPAKTSNTESGNMTFVKLYSYYFSASCLKIQFKNGCVIIETCHILLSNLSFVNLILLVFFNNVKLLYVLNLVKKCKIMRDMEFSYRGTASQRTTNVSTTLTTARK